MHSSYHRTRRPASEPAVHSLPCSLPTVQTGVRLVASPNLKSACETIVVIITITSPTTGLVRGLLKEIKQDSTWSDAKQQEARIRVSFQQCHRKRIEPTDVY